MTKLPSNIVKKQQNEIPVILGLASVERDFNGNANTSGCDHCILGKPICKGNRRNRRELGPSIFKCRIHGGLNEFAVEFEFLDQVIQIPKILHLPLPESHHRFEFLHDRFLRVDLQMRSKEIQRVGKSAISGPGVAALPKPTYQKLYPRLPPALQ